MSTLYTTADDPSESRWVQTGQGLLRHGWSVGKKVAVAGAAISVAPLLIPPLLVFSAFGLALSVPFGIYYAGMVGTERLMQSLLPLCQDQEVAQINQEEGDEIVEDEQGYSDQIDYRCEENWEMKGDDDEIVEEGKGYVGKWDSKTEENGGEGGDDRDASTKEHGEMNKDNGVVGYLDERDEMVEKRKENNVTEEGLEPEKDGKTEHDVIVEIPKEEVDVVEETGATKRDPMRGEPENNNVNVETIIDITGATVDKDSVTMVKIEIKPDKANSTTMTEEGTEIAGAEAIQVEIGNTEVVEDKGMVIADTDSNVAEKGENELSAVTSEGADVSEVEGKSDMADSESRSSAEHVEVKDFNVLASASSESPVTSDAEVK